MNGIKESHNKVKPLKGFLLLLFSVICLSLIVGIIYLVPTYVNLPIPFQSDQLEGSVFCDSQTHSVYRSLDISTRDYVLREECYLSFANSENEIPSWKSIMDYYEKQLNSLGWERSESFTPCRIYLAEAKFLPVNEKDGYVYFQKSNYRLNTSGEEDFICLAVWPEKSSDHLYNIVWLAVRPSLFLKTVGFLFPD